MKKTIGISIFVVAFIVALAACTPENETPVADSGENGGNAVYVAAGVHIQDAVEQDAPPFYPP